MKRNGKRGDMKKTLGRERRAKKMEGNMTEEEREENKDNNDECR